MSTESPTQARPAGLDLDRPWRLHPQVSVRPEPFGALLYHFGTRKLSFLKDRRLLDAVRGLDGASSAADACAAAGVADAELPRFARALETLRASQMLDTRPIVERAAHSIGDPVARRAPHAQRSEAQPGRLVDLFEYGLDSPICLTWELTYACNLSCVHCLSSSGRRDPRELTTDECKAVIDELERMQVFYVNIGGGEPTVRSDFWEIVDYATSHHVGVKFSTNGVKITPERASELARNDYLDIQISLDGATAEVNDHVRGPGSYETALTAMQNLKDAGMKNFKLSVVCTRYNVPQLDEFKAIAEQYGAQLRLTRLRPSGRGADTWDDLHPLPEQQRQLYDWLVAHGDGVLTGDSFFHLSAYGQALPGLNLCGAGRVVCLIDPVGDVYACPFAIHDEFRAGNVRDAGGFQDVWRSSELFQRLREPQSGGACTSCQFFDTCKGGCMAAKFFTGLPLDGPDPECVQGYGEELLKNAKAKEHLVGVPRPGVDHSHRTSPPRPREGMGPVRITLRRREELERPPVNACEADPLAGFPAR